MTEPDYLKPFVLPTEPTTIEPTTIERKGPADLYLPTAADGPLPAIVFIHGGPVSEQMRPAPREWPVFRGYGATAAARGAVGVTVDHGPHAMPDPFGPALRLLHTTIDEVRADERVDPDRIALWFFSGAGLLAGEWLRARPAWLRCVAASYPLFAPLPQWPDNPAWHAVDALGDVGDLPIVLTRVGREAPPIAATVAEFVAAAPAGLEIIDVPDGRHGFDYLDDTDQSRDAIRQAFDSVLRHLA